MLQLSRSKVCKDFRANTTRHSFELFYTRRTSLCYMRLSLRYKQTFPKVERPIKKSHVLLKSQLITSCKVNLGALYRLHIQKLWS